MVVYDICLHVTVRCSITIDYKQTVMESNMVSEILNFNLRLSLLECHSLMCHPVMMLLTTKKKISPVAPSSGV